jgi:hypothetical protein
MEKRRGVEEGRKERADVRTGSRGEGEEEGEHTTL